MPAAPGWCGRTARRIWTASSSAALWWHSRCLAGLCLCLVNTYGSIGFIVLVQLNYVFAPRWGVLARI